MGAENIIKAPLMSFGLLEYSDGIFSFFSIKVLVTVTSPLSIRLQSLSLYFINSLEYYAASHGDSHSFPFESSKSSPGFSWYFNLFGSEFKSTADIRHA